MSVRLIILLTTLALGACGAGQQGGTTPASPEVRQQAVDEVTQITAQHCEDGVHGTLDHVAADGPLLIVGTAGEIIEGRPTLDEVNQSYTTRNVEVGHDCDGVQRFVFSAEAANVVWVEEALRTHASWPGFSVNFPSQRTSIYERTTDGWRLRYYSLSVRLPDDQLDEAYAQPASDAAPAGDAAAAAPTEDAAPPAAPAEGE